MSIELPSSTDPRPTWEVAQLFPNQGDWGEAEFFELHSNRMLELVAGRLEILPMPTWMHQLMVDFLADQIKCFLKAGTGGRVLQAPLPIRLFPKTIREPDVMYFAPGSEPDDPNGYPTHVDLAMEVVSDGDKARKRDYEDKRLDYAKAAIPEYWIIDPANSTVTVLVLQKEAYDVDGVYGVGEVAVSRLLQGLAVEVADLMGVCDREQFTHRCRVGDAHPVKERAAADNSAYLAAANLVATASQSTTFQNAPM